MTHRVAVIGTGPNPDDPGPEGYGMGYRHARGYSRIKECELVACADIVLENAEKFALEFGVENVYDDYEVMLREVEPDLVSVCVPPAAHADIVIGCAKSGVVDAVHCEKPMAETWADCREMACVCEEEGVQLTINHQRRFGVPFKTAKKLIDNGTIGELSRFEFSATTIYDMGIHLFDLCNYYVDHASAEWVLAQVDYREENIWFGAHNENQGLVQWKYETGVYGLGSTGVGADFVGCYLRIVGSEGVIEIGVEDGPTLRMRRDGSGWERIDTDGETIHGPTSPGLPRAAVRKVASLLPGISEERFSQSSLHYRSLKSVVRAMRTDEEPELGTTSALAATELVFASWESARRTGRVDLPLEIDDNPLQTMVEEGRLLTKNRT